jgi:universal stress protein A
MEKTQMFKKILCPIDFSDGSINALKHAVKMAVKDAADLYLIYVEDKIDYEGLRFGTEYNLDSETIAKLDKKLMNVIPEDVRDCIKAEILITAGTPADEILKAALDKEVDLVVMGTHGRTGIAHMVIGSVAESVIKKAPCPVLCIRK